MAPTSVNAFRKKIEDEEKKKKQRELQEKVNQSQAAVRQPEKTGSLADDYYRTWRSMNSGEKNAYTRQVNNAIINKIMPGGNRTTRKNQPAEAQKLFKSGQGLSGVGAILKSKDQSKLSFRDRSYLSELENPKSQLYKQANKPGEYRAEASQRAWEKYYNNIINLGKGASGRFKDSELGTWAGDMPKDVQEAMMAGKANAYVQGQQYYKKTGALNDLGDFSLMDRAGLLKAQETHTAKKKAAEESKKKYSDMMDADRQWEPDYSGLMGLYREGDFENEQNQLAGYDDEESIRSANDRLAALQRERDNYAYGLAENALREIDPDLKDEDRLAYIYDQINGEGAYQARTEGMSPDTKAQLNEKISGAIKMAESPYGGDYYDDMLKADSTIRYEDQQLKQIERYLKMDEEYEGVLNYNPELEALKEEKEEIENNIANLEYIGRDDQPGYANLKNRLRIINRKISEISLAGGTAKRDTAFHPEYDKGNDTTADIIRDNADNDMHAVYSFINGGVNSKAYTNDMRVNKSYHYAVMMTQEEKDAFNGYYNMNPDDPKEAQAFMEALEPYLQDRYSQFEELGLRQFATQLPIISTGLGRVATIMEPFMAIGTGLDTVFNGGKNASNPNSDLFAPTRFKQITQAQITRNLGDVGGLIYGAATSGIDSALNAFIAAGTGASGKALEALTLTLFGAEAFQGSLYKNLEETGDFGASLAHAAIDTLIETATEVFSVEQLMKDPSNFVQYLLKTSGAEASEEFAGSTLGPYINKLLTGTNEWEQMADRIYNEKGYTDENGKWVDLSNLSDDDLYNEAKRHALKEWNNEIFNSTVSGALSTGGGIAYGGVQNLTGTYYAGRNANQNARTRGINAAESLTKAALTLDPNSKSYALALKIKDDLDAGKRINSYRTGKLAQTMYQETSEKVGETIKDVLQNNVKDDLTAAGMETEQAEEMSSAIATVVTKGFNSLTKKMRALLSSSETALKTLEEYLSDPEKAIKVNIEARNETKNEYAVRQEVKDLITPEKAKASESSRDVADAYKDAGQYTADGSDIALAKGKRTGEADAIVDGEFRQITGIRNGKVLVTDRKGNTAELEIGEIKATNRNVAALISFTVRHSGLISDRYATKALEVVANMKKNQYGPKVLDDIVKIRMAGMTEGTLPATTLDTKAAEGLYQEAQTEFEEEDAKRIKKQPVVMPGKGRMIFNGTIYGTNAFEEAAKSLSKRARETARVLGEIATRMGFTVNLINNPKISKTFGWEEEATGTVTINLAGQRTKIDMQHILATAGHEFTHWLEQNSVEGYKKLRSFIFDMLRKSGKNVNSMVMQLMDERNALTTEQKKEKNGDGTATQLTNEQNALLAEQEKETTVSLMDAVKELVANSCDQVLGNRKVIDELANTDPDLFDKAKTYMRNFLSRLKNALQGLGESTTRESRALRGFYDELSELWVGALNEARGRQAGGAEGTETRMAQTQTQDMDEIHKKYAGNSLYTDASVYDYDFMISLPDIQITKEGALNDVLTNGNLDENKIRDIAFNRAIKEAGGRQNGNTVTVNNLYTGRDIVLTKRGINHSTFTNNAKSNNANARIAQAAGVLAQRAVPINGLTNKKMDVAGTYAMAAPVIGADGNIQKVAILTVEVKSGNLVGIDVYDQLHAISGRKKNEVDHNKANASVMRSVGASQPTAATRSTMTISDFLNTVNSTHRSILSQSVLDHFNEKRPDNGYYTGKALFSMAQVSQEDQAYADAVERGDLETATSMLMDKLQHSENIIPFNAPEWYGGQHKDIAQMIKNGTPEAVARAAERMASFVPDNGVLVPMPPHEGKVLDDTDTKILADAISELTGRPVVVALESDPRESRYEAKSKGKKGVKAEDMGFRQVAEIPEGTIPIFVDNVVGSGETAKAAMQAMGGGITLAYAKSSIARSPGIQGLKRAVVTYDNDKKLIPLSQRFDASVRDIRYAMAQDGEEMTFDSLDIPQLVYFKGTDAEIDAAEQKQEARANEFRKLIDNDNFVALEYTHPDGRTEILTRSIRPGVRYQLSYIGSDGIPNMHESYGESGDGKNTTENIHSMDELYRHLVNENSRRELKMTVLNEESSRKYSMAQRSEEYNQAVRSGDMETAQRLVDEAAEVAMPNSKIRGKDGKLLRIYHGTEEMFYEFDTSKHGGEHGTAEGYGIYLTDTQDVSEKYGSRQISGYVNITRPAYSDRRTLKKAELVRLIKAACEQEARTMVEDGEIDSMKQALPNTWISNYVYTPEYRSINDAYAAVAESFMRMHDNDSDIVKEVVFGMGINSYKEAMDFYHNILTPTTGIDGIWEKWGTEEDGNLVNVFLAFDSSQIKEADPVTYDDNGNVIPLDERFNQEKSDIRYAMAQSDMDVRVWMQNLTEEMLVTEQEKNMLKQYKNQRMAVDIDRKMINDQNAIIRKIKAKGTITPYDRSELIKAQNILQNYENKLQRDEEALAKVTSSEGYAALMYKQSKLMNDLVNGRTAEEVMQTVEAIQRKIAGVDREMKENEERLNRLAGAEGVVAAKTWFAGKGLRETAQRLKKNFLSSLNLQEIENRLASIALRLNQNGYNAEEVMDDVTTLAEMLADKTKAAGDQSYILQELRGSIFYLNKAQMKELSGTHRTMKDINRELAGTGIKFREAKAGDTTLDQVYDQLRETIPSLPDTTDTQMADELLDLIRRERRSEAENIINSNMGEVIQAVFEEAMTLAPTKNAGQANKAQIETLIKYISELAGEARKSAEVMNALQATVKKLSKEATTAREGARRLDLNIGDAIKYFNTLTQQSEAVIWRGERAKLISQLKDEKTKALIAEQQKWRDRIEKDKNVRNKMADNARIRSMITVNTSRLRKLLEAETDQKNVPEHMKGLAWEMLRMIVGNDLGESRRKITNTEKKKLERTQQVYKLWENEHGPFGIDQLTTITNIIHDEQVQDFIENALADIEDGIAFYNNATHGKDIMANVQALYNSLNKVLEGVTNIMEIIRAEGTVMFQERRVAVEDAANDVKFDLGRSRFKGEYTGLTRKEREMFDRLVVHGNMTPVYFFKNLRNRGMDNLWREFESGENRNGLELYKIKEFMDTVAEETGYSTWDMEKKYNVPMSGATVKMTLEQLMALYATWRREQTVGPEMSSHLKLGGVYVEEDTMDKGFAGRKKVEARAHRVTDEDMAAVEAMLTPKQLEYVNRVVGYMSNEMSNLGNEASMKMYGIKKYNEKYYFPMQIWDGVRYFSSDKGGAGTDQNRIAHMSWSKRRVNNAKNALVIGNFTDIATKHMVQMVNYVTMAPAIENMRKVLNYQFEEGVGEALTRRNLEAMLRESYGNTAMNYLNTFVSDLNGGVKQDSRKTIGEAALRIFKKNAVAGSLSVTLQQPLSYIRAAVLLNPKYLTKAIMSQYWKGSYEERMKYSGVSVIKDMGPFDINLGRSAREYIAPEKKEGKARTAWNKVSEYSTILPELADRWTWNRMWVACKAEQHDLHPEMDVKSDEFLKLVANRFNELIRKTQVYDSLLVKSSNMRSPNQAMKAMTSFMAEPTLTLNVLYDAAANVKEKGGKMQLVRASALYLASAAAQAAVKALLGSGRSPDDKKTKWENLLNKFMYNAINEIDLLQSIPGYGDLITILKGEDVTDDALAVLTKIPKSIITGIKALEGKGNGLYRDLEDSAAQLAQLFTGVPMKNIMRDGRAMYNYFVNPNAYASRDSSAAVIKYQAIDSLWNADNLIGALNKQLIDAGAGGYETTSSAYEKRLYEANKAGNKTKVQELFEYLERIKVGGKDPKKTINSALVGLTKKDDSLTVKEKLETMKQYGADKTTTYILDEYKKGNLKRSEAEKLYKQENQKATDKTILQAFDKADRETAGEDTEDYTNYTPLKEAVEANSSEKIQKAVKHLMDNGYKAADIREKLGTEYKKKYVEMKGGTAEKVKLQDALTKAFKATGMTADQATKELKEWPTEVQKADRDKWKREAREKYEAGSMTKQQLISEYKKQYPTITDQDAWLWADRIAFENETGEDVSNMKWHRIYYAARTGDTKNLSQYVREMKSVGLIGDDGVKKSLMTEYLDELKKGNEWPKSGVIRTMMQADGISQAQAEKYFNQRMKTYQKNQQKKAGQ